MSTIVGILTFTSRITFMLCRVEHEKKLNNLWPSWCGDDGMGTPRRQRKLHAYSEGIDVTAHTMELRYQPLWYVRRLFETT